MPRWSRASLPASARRRRPSCGKKGLAGVPEVHFSISMRYVGQNYEHQVPVPAETMTEAVLRDAFSSFEKIHAERYGYAIEGEEIELVSFRVTVTGRRSAPRLVVHERERCEPPSRPAASSISGGIGARSDRHLPSLRLAERERDSTVPASSRNRARQRWSNRG